jgi:hypothetical protein
LGSGKAGKAPVGDLAESNSDSAKKSDQERGEKFRLMGVVVKKGDDMGFSTDCCGLGTGSFRFLWGF